MTVVFPSFTRAEPSAVLIEPGKVNLVFIKNFKKKKKKENNHKVSYKVV